jgi:putative ABC transport system permease protein
MKLILLKTALRDSLRRPWLTGLMIFSVAVGVAVVVAIDLANASAARAFNLSTEAVVGRATHQIIGGPRGVDEAVYRELRVIQGYRLSAPLVDGYASALEMDRQTMHVLGVDPFAEAPFRNYFSPKSNVQYPTSNLQPPITNYQLPNSNSPLDAFAQFYTRAGAALISEASAKRHGVKLGDTLTLRVDMQTKQAVIVGFLRPPDEASERALEGLMLTDIATAQELFNMQGRLSRIDLIASEEMAKAITTRLPQGLTLIPASEQANTVTQLTAAFQLNLTAFSLLALVVGMFLIYNTVMFSVVQRRRTLGILRSLGVTGQDLFRLVLFEATLLGAIGSLIGLALGVLLGRAAVALVTQTINDLYFSVTVNSVEVQPFTLVKGVVLGIGSALLAAVLPAAEAANVPPMTTLQRSDLEARVRRALPRLTQIGFAMFLLGAALISFIQSSVIASFVGIFVGLFGVVLMVPLITIWLMRLTTRTVGRMGLLPRMAARTVTNALSRTSIAIAALMVAVSVTIGVTVMIASFRATVGVWLDATLLADIYVSSPQSSSNRAVTIDPSLVQRIANVPGIRSIETYRNVTVHSPDLGAVRLNAVTATKRRGATVYRWAIGTPDQVWDAVEQGAVVVTEPFANRHGISVPSSMSNVQRPTSNDQSPNPANNTATSNPRLPTPNSQLPITHYPLPTVQLLTDKGVRAFPVVAISYDYSSDQGAIVMHLDTYRQNWNDHDISSVAAFVAPEADAKQIEDAVRAALSGAGVRVQSNKALREVALVIFDRTFAITSALRIVAIVVAFIGILSALMALQLERTRELGTLRAAGMTLPQLWRLTLMETGLMGATAGLLAMPTGLALSAVLIYVINLRSFGWTIFFSPVPEVYLQALIVSVFAALCAGVYPMWRMGKMEVAAALRSE